MRSIGLVVQANSSARSGKAANPISRSGRRPQLVAWRPAHGAMIATIICGTMIIAEKMSEEKASFLYTSASPASEMPSGPGKYVGAATESVRGGGDPPRAIGPIFFAGPDAEERAHALRQVRLHPHPSVPLTL